MSLLTYFKMIKKILPLFILINTALSVIERTTSFVICKEHNLEILYNNYLRVEDDPHLVLQAYFVNFITSNLFFFRRINCVNTVLADKVMV